MDCPLCESEMFQKTDNVIGVNFDGSFYVKKPITIHHCQPCNFLQK